MSEIIQLAMTDCQNVKSLEQLSFGERFISPLQLDNNKWSLALYQLTKLGEWRLIKRYDKSQAHLGCKLEVVEQKGRNIAQANGSKFCPLQIQSTPNRKPKISIISSSLADPTTSATTILPSSSSKPSPVDLADYRRRHPHKRDAEYGGRSHCT